MDFCGQRGKLPQIGKVAREKNDAANQRMTEAFAHPGRSALCRRCRSSRGQGVNGSCLLQNDERDGVIGFIADRELGAQAPYFEQFSGVSPQQSNPGLPSSSWVIAMAFKLAGGRMPVPSALLNASLAAKRLARKRPLSLAASNAAYPCGASSRSRALSPWRSQKACRRLIGDNVGADAVNHSPCPAASRISAFISRTASRRPTKIARLIIA